MRRRRRSHASVKPETEHREIHGAKLVDFAVRNDFAESVLPQIRLQNLGEKGWTCRGMGSCLADGLRPTPLWISLKKPTALAR